MQQAVKVECRKCRYKYIRTNFPCDLEFDLSTLKLYWSYQNEGKNGTESYLAEIDAATGKILSQKAYKDKEAVIGLYFPEKLLNQVLHGMDTAMPMIIYSTEKPVKMRVSYHSILKTWHPYPYFQLL